jgi:alcohol dehydrogenase
MKALTFHGPGKRIWGEAPNPVVVAPEDAVVRVDAVTICGTDLHIGPLLIIRERLLCTF